MRARRILMLPIVLGVVAMAASSCIIVDDHPPRADFYAPCDFDSDCRGGAACWSISIEYDWGVATERMCTSECTWDSDCAYGGACQDPDHGRALCYARCASDDDCHAGFACVEQIGDYAYDPMCMPW